MSNLSTLESVRSSQALGPIFAQAIGVPGIATTTARESLEAMNLRFRPVHPFARTGFVGCSKN